MDPNNLGELRAQAQQLSDRLERISADSPWAHQASGVRASIARALSTGNLDQPDLKELMTMGYQILVNAAAEIPDDANQK
jgi:hypothetical protein